MIFYGDQVRSVRTGDALAELAEILQAGPGLCLPIERHAALISAVIGAGELAQGVSDAAFLANGVDDCTDSERAIMAIVHRLALLAGHSWDQGLAGAPPDAVAALALSLDALRNGALPDEIVMRQPEGFAHYAVYPECYWMAAKALGPSPDAQVIGIRSIGTSLGAMVAAALGADVPLTVRPAGHPFAREIRAGARLEAALRANASSMRAIVDEGPGLSGSSFGAVADALEQRGIVESKLVFFPSHSNAPGPEASPRHRARWARARRFVTDFDALALRAAAPEQRLDCWARDITGAPLAPLLDLGRGNWRAGPQERWPPCDSQNERRKFLLEAERGRFLLKFAGLGESGRRTLARAEALAKAGFCLPVLGMRHGFLVERWRDDLACLDLAKLDRTAFVRHLGAYLGFRARALPARPDSSASLEALYGMMIHNAPPPLGGPDGRLAQWKPHLARLALQSRRVETDNRLHAWEWLTSEDGRWIKTDAVDHCAGHDLIGCQDIAWDAAGAAIEFDLAPDQEAALLAVLDNAAGRAISRELVSFCKPAYAAFQFGAFSMARDRSEGAEAVRLGRAVQRYADAINR